MIERYLLDEIKSLIADAERYKFIKSRSRASSANIDGMHSWYCDTSNIRGATLDQAIDDAIKADHG